MHTLFCIYFTSTFRSGYILSLLQTFHKNKHKHFIFFLTMLTLFSWRDRIPIDTTNKSNIGRRCDHSDTTRATGNSRSGIPGNLALPNSRREFPGILRKLRSVIFSLLFLHYLSSFITIYNKH